VSKRRVDVLVVGAGPAGSIAALVLARAGASVALVDRARFPRDKACGDFVGPRGLQVLVDLGVPEPPGLDVGDMLVVGPTGRKVLLPSFDGVGYPGRARAVTRTVFDDALRTAALAAGATAYEGRADRPLSSGDELDGFTVTAGNGDGRGPIGGRPAGGEEIRADFVIGADGATSHVAESAGLVERARVLWGFAVRTYLDQPVDLPAITLWEPTPWHAFPGYGWVFPGPGGEANVGVGVGTLADRTVGARAVQVLPDYLDHLVRLGLLDRPPIRPLARRLGGWLKMGMVGTTAASGRVLLAGDAAGLVNPLQGEGIAQAMTSGMAAAEAIITAPQEASLVYRDRLARDHLPYHRVTAAAHAALVGHPVAVSTIGRLLTAPALGEALAGGWGIFWNELLDGAAPGRARQLSAAATWLARAVTSRTEVARWFLSTYGDPDHRIDHPSSPRAWSRYAAFSTQRAPARPTGRRRD
jgi:geranylgeranyl reductase family protein